MRGINEIDQRVLDSLSGRDKIKALLSGRGLTLKAFAEKHNQWVQHVSECLGGVREFPEIRDALADELGMDRDEVAALIDEEAA